MADSSSLVQVALNELKINQKQLADLLDVSTGQISRWKNHNDYMSMELDKKLVELCGLGNIPANFVLLTGSLNNARKWEKAIRLCAEIAEQDNESGYECYPLVDFDDLGILFDLALVLTELGVVFPEEVPDPINEIFENVDLDDETWECFHELEQIDLISALFSVYTDLIGFNSAYISELSDLDDIELMELTMEIEACYLHLAACKLEVNSQVAPNFEAHKMEWTRWYKQKLVELKKAAVEANSPLREELLSLVNDEAGEISSAAERQALGLNDAALHPDIYMNELLVGMRAIHQVLPAILQKLGIDPKKFQIDQSEFHNN